MPVMDKDEMEKGIDQKNVLRWLAKMQGGGMDLGGFKGRTNKLVDGCYSWWVGGCFALLDGMNAPEEIETVTVDADANAETDEWDNVEGRRFCLSFELKNTK